MDVDEFVEPKEIGIQRGLEVKGGEAGADEVAGVARRGSIHQRRRHSEECQCCVGYEQSP